MKSSLASLAWMAALGLGSAQVSTAAERINHEGRILPPTPALTKPVLFNTPEADGIIASLQILPRDNAWNEDISRQPALSNSTDMLAQIVADFDGAGANNKKLRANYDMNFVIVPGDQAKIQLSLDLYPGESDPPPYPWPSNTPIEGWPVTRPGESLQAAQTDTKDTSDRHAVVVDPANGFIYETWQTLLKSRTWHASCGAKFPLNSNNPRPAGWTSADAGGLSIFAGTIRYDECERGVVEHALRMVVRHTRKECLYPANHYASTIPASSVNYPAMGQRLRLKASFAIPDSWGKEAKAVVAALKKYGAIVTDNGSVYSLSAAPDNRFPAGAFDALNALTPDDFEVVASTGPDSGPRTASPAAPTADAGPDQTVASGTAVQLAGSVTGSNLAVQWRLYTDATHSNPGTAAFADATQPGTTATFSAPGKYTLMLSASDNLHAVAYDAVTITVGPGGQTSPIDITTDSDGDGLCDAYEFVAGLDPHNPDTNGNGILDGDEIDSATGATYIQAQQVWLAANTTSALTLGKISGTVNFKKPGHDKAVITGTIPTALNFAQATVTVYAAGENEQFTFAGRGGAAHSANGSTLSLRVLRGTTTFTLTVKNANWGQTWNGASIDSAVSQTGVAVDFPLSLTLGGQTYGAGATVKFTSRAGKTGTFRK